MSSWYDIGKSIGIQLWISADFDFSLQVIAGSEGEAAEGELVLHVKEIVNSGRSEEIHVEEDIVAAAGSGEAGDESNAYQSFDEAEDDHSACVNETLLWGVEVK